MWLSNVPMQHRIFGVKPKWEDNYWVHTRVMSLFGELESPVFARRSSNILYRVEPGIGNGRVLVQSSIRPLAKGIQTIDLDGIFARLNEGELVRFQVKVNSVKTINHRSGGIQRKHRAVVPEDEMASWLMNKLSPGLTDMELDSCITGTEHQRNVPIVVATVSGMATVGNAAALKDQVSIGVGKAKSFGCGLLSVIPAG